MASIKDLAENYTVSETLNIAELEKVPVAIDCVEETFKEGTPEQFTAFITQIEGVRYRVPKTVLRDLKVLLEDDPKMTHFRVIRKGQGMNTDYTTLPVKA